MTTHIINKHIVFKQVLVLWLVVEQLEMPFVLLLIIIKGQHQAVKSKTESSRAKHIQHFSGNKSRANQIAESHQSLKSNTYKKTTTHSGHQNDMMI